MTPFVTLSWNPNRPDAEMLAQNVRAIIRTEWSGWRAIVDRGGAIVAVRGNGNALTAGWQGHATCILGDLFPRSRGQSADPFATEASFEDVCRRLVSDYWGAYTAIQLRPDGDMSVFRDPIGMRDCMTWTKCGVRIVASDPGHWLPLFAPDGLAIDWRLLAGLLLDTSTVFEASPLIGPDTCPPGVLVRFDGGERTTRRLWQPRHFYDPRQAGQTSPESLRERVVDCVGQWAEAYPNNLLEISGGFDSAVVAAAANMSGHGIRRGINFFAEDFAGDERRYARAVRDGCRIPLDEVAMPVGQLGECDLKDMPVGARPGLGSTTLFHDRVLARVATSYAAIALFTGHGGDSVFFQHPTAMVAADPSFPRGRLHAHLALARWSRSSFWTVSRHAFRLPINHADDQPDGAIAALPMRGPIKRAWSSWAADVSGLPPAKQAQIHGIAGDRAAFGPSWRSAALTVVHPLLSQPIVELAIATDTFALTRGRRDRAMAREAFANDLPRPVAARRGKGALTYFFGRSLAASTPFLRSFLLDGLLVENSILDRYRLEPMLDSDFLMQFDCYAGLLLATIMEHWARVWNMRLDAIRSGDSLQRGARPVPSPTN